MNNDESKEYRIDKPMDYLHQRLFQINGPLMHELFNFPGKYEGPCPNRNMNADGSQAEVDISYMVKCKNGEKLIINVEDETSSVKEDTLRKCNKYKINHQYAYRLPVFSAITTTLEIRKCLKELRISPTDIFRPKIISYLEFDGEKILSSLKCKILNNRLLTKIELIKLILVIRTFPNNHAIILEEICDLIKKARTSDMEFKMEMVYCSRYIIHKYAKTDDDIIRLEEAIGLKKAVTCGSIIENIKNEGIEQGIEQGKAKGKLDVLKTLANDPKCGYTLNELADKFGYTPEQIINGK